MSDLKMKALAEFGQSIWLDYIDRPLLETDKLKNMIDDGLRGMTSNPSIFNNAIGNSDDYDKAIVKLKEGGSSIFEIYDALTIEDIQQACDQFSRLYHDTDFKDGYVSLEINPELANKIDEQIEEGARLFKEVNRPNVMIKVPSTHEGIPVIEELISMGINVNATLIFSVGQYERVVNAYLAGLNRFAKNEDDLSKIHSVASVFVSRIDTAVDNLLQEKIEGGNDELKPLLGKAAVANSRIIFEKNKELFSQKLFHDLFDLKGNAQRVLWASTGTKNPEYSDIKYVTELISKPTVNTLPEKTLDAFLDHGEIKDALDYDCKEAEAIIDQLRENGIDIDEVCAQLLEDGVKAFADAFSELFKSIEDKANKLTLT